MSPSRQTVSSSFRGIDFLKLKQWLANPRALGLPLAIFILIYPVAIGSLQAPPPGLSFPIPTWAWDLLTGLGASLVLITARFFLKRSGFGQTIVVWLLACLTGAMLPVAVGSLFETVANRLLAGIPVGAMSLFGLMLLFTIVSSTFSEYRDSNRELATSVSELEIRRSSLSEELSRRQQDLAKRISDQISPRIQAVADLIQSAQTQQAAKEIFDIINNLVRPVSKSLSEDSAVLSWQEVRPAPKTNWLTRILRAQAKRVRLSSIFAPDLPVILAVIFFTDAMSLAAGFAGVGYLFGFLALVFFCYLLLARATGQTEIPYLALHLVSLVLAAVLGWIYVQGAAVLGLTGTTGLTEFVGFGVFLVFSFAGFASIYIAGKALANSELIQVAQRLSAVVGELQLKTAALNKQMGLDLHGDVQAKLQAALVRLSRTTETQGGELEQVVKDLQLATDSLLGEKVRVQGLALFDEIIQLWDSICEVTINIDIESSRAMELNGELCSLAAEIVRERVINAVKHSSAEEIDISIIAAPDRLTISSRNQDFAHQYSQGKTAGVGSAFLDSASLSWSLDFDGGDVVFRAEISR